MFAWDVTCRWVVHNGRFILNCPIPLGTKILFTNTSIYTHKGIDLMIEGNIKEEKYLMLDESILTKDQRILHIPRKTSEILSSEKVQEPYCR
jgi:hypothetical protein